MTINNMLVHVSQSRDEPAEEVGPAVLPGPADDDTGDDLGGDQGACVVQEHHTYAFPPGGLDCGLAYTHAYAAVRIIGKPSISLGHLHFCLSKYSFRPRPFFLVGSHSYPNIHSILRDPEVIHISPLAEMLFTVLLYELLLALVKLIHRTFFRVSYTKLIRGKYIKDQERKPVAANS
ncbi:uncharacterized protein BCR38DRAFT_482527 [Pseudomassariella vexata]|uniref:Uncharacterized protein n=1 Tax=Pseudomassariella vexata TaxID=1141098 RepID=A0A1Y2ECN2_9PEZI|nr:uncharacterized protein BCR38DRAFT_482527 [Pseudomassariella vexata]ORY69054.1 hypothetical protein BCR38DRAFT_482527 [Pseudomassariella vexata]